jgi:hypothetical protein
MHPITKKIRHAGMTKKEWCEKNGVNSQYLSQIFAGRRGFSSIGEAGRIKALLKAQGLWAEKPKKKSNR